MAYRESFEQCPRCGHTLEDAGAVRACQGCRGQWVLEPVLAEMVMTMLPPGVVGQLTLVPSAPRGSTLACPSCGTAMDAVTMYGAPLERCAKGHGVWFDPDELQAGLRDAADPARHAEPVADVAPPAPTPVASDPKAFDVDAVLGLPPQRPQAHAPSPPLRISDARVDEVVLALRRGVPFPVDGHHYRWDPVQGTGGAVIDGKRSYSREELRALIAAHPSAFDPERALLAFVIDKMKAGMTVGIRPGPLYDEYGWDRETGKLYRDTIEWTYPTRYGCSESELAAAIAKDTNDFAPLLYK